MNTLSEEDLKNGVVNNRDFKVFSIKDVFNEDNINTIMHHYKRFEHYYQAVGYAGQRKWGLNYPEIFERLQAVVSDHLGEEVVASEVELCIYTPDFGYTPKLYPHCDNHESDGQRVTMSVQLDANVDWDLVVENKKYKCNKNEGIVFSGTQQVHWRDNIEFKDGDYSASVFAHFKYKNKKELSPNQKDILTYWEKTYQIESGIPLEVIESDRKMGNWSLRNDWIEKANSVFFKGRE